MMRSGAIRIYECPIFYFLFLLFFILFYTFLFFIFSLFIFLFNILLAARHFLYIMAGS